MTNPIHFTTAEEAVKVIKSGDHVHLSSVASAPQCLINAMCKRGEAGELKDVHVHHLHTDVVGHARRVVDIGEDSSSTPSSWVRTSAR